MDDTTIRKEPPKAGLQHNLADYEQARAHFAWDDARRALTGLPDGQGLNIAFEAVDRHALAAKAERVALRWLSKDRECRDYTYAELKRLTNRFANVLRSLGLQAGDRVVTLLGRKPELYIAALGTLKFGGVFCPLFAAFGPEPVRARMSRGQARLLVTTPRLYQRKVAPIRGQLPELQTVILVGEDAALEQEANIISWRRALASAAETFSIPPTSPEAPALLHFTSGTTGTPKGALHVHQAAVVHHMTGRYVLDLQDDDIFWCTADPGWVTGTSYGIIAPLVCGVTNLVDEADFNTRRWYEILEQQRVSVWYTAPTAVRMLMKAGDEALLGHAFKTLRHIASVGEPLDPDAVVWGQKAFGIPIHDNWWQTETGGIMVANYPAVDIKPGSMGLPLPGVEAAVAMTHDGGLRFLPPGEEGELVLRANWPSMFRAYIHDERRYDASFADGWYLSGDLVKRDRDGYFWFVGRADDVIKSAGHLIGPFEVESALLEHGAVAEAAVIGKPDPVAGAVVKAFVELTGAHADTPQLRKNILAFVRRRLGPAIAPKELDVVSALPRTRSGKLMRRLLRARELGLPEGDLSTLETGA